jgi:putative copper export protein
MLPVTARAIRLTLHVLGVTVWVGGQLTLLGILPALRAAQGDVAATVARRFERVAWPAFALVIATGIWNLVAIDVGDTSSDYQATLLAKLVFVGLSGVGAFLHGRATSRAALAVWGAVGLLSALLALFYGVLLAAG